MNAQEILITAIGSGSLFAFIQFLISRFDTKHDRIAKLEKRFDEDVEKRSIDQTEIAENHQKEWKRFQDAIDAMVKSDNKFAEAISKIADKQDIMALATVGMIHNSIIQYTTPIIVRGAVTYEELANLDSLYIPYSKLGGNGECKRRYEDVNKLIKISKEEAIKRDKEIESKKLQELQSIICTTNRGEYEREVDE